MGGADPRIERWLVLASVLHRLTSLGGQDRVRYARSTGQIFYPSADGNGVRHAQSAARRGAGAAPTPRRDSLPGTFGGSSNATIAELLRAWKGRVATEPFIRGMQGEAEEMERAGAFHLALSTLQALQPLIGDAQRRARGYVFAQMGRIARQMGQLEAAESYYALARDLATEVDDGELVARASIGLGVVFVQRGNYPAARESYTLALSSVDAASPSVRGAHHGLMLAAMAAHDYDTAFHHGWQAFLCAGEDTDSRADALINLGELCRLVGRNATALRAFRASLGLTQLLRFQLPALGGAVLAASALGEWELVGALSRVAERLSKEGELPYEQTRMWISFANAAIARPDVEAASAYVRRARHMASAAGFHELLWQIDALDEQIARLGTPGERRREAAPTPRRERRAAVGGAVRLGTASTSVITELDALPVAHAADALLSVRW